MAGTGLRVMFDHAAELLLQREWFSNLRANLKPFSWCKSSSFLTTLETRNDSYLLISTRILQTTRSLDAQGRGFLRERWVQFGLKARQDNTG